MRVRSSCRPGVLAVTIYSVSNVGSVAVMLVLIVTVVTANVAVEVKKMSVGSPSKADRCLAMKAKKITTTHQVVYKVTLFANREEHTWYTHAVEEGLHGIKFDDLKEGTPVLIGGTYMVEQDDTMEEDDE